MNKTLVAIFLSTVAGSAYAACPAGTTMVDADTCRMEGAYTSDLQLTADKTWLLRGGVFIGGDNRDSAVLNVAPGTVVKGETGNDYLVISRGSRIEAIGTAEQPIIFTSDNMSAGGWGGLVINGNAPINGCAEAPCEAEGEGNTGMYGGTDTDDNSGTLQFVRIEYAGYQISPDNELNGISFQGVGRGTLIQNVQVHMTADDGVEFYGGTVDIRNVVITGAQDDSLDWVNGWQGRGQFILVKQLNSGANNGIEGDNFKLDHAAAPRSMPTLSNVTLIGSAADSVDGGNALKLRRGTGLKLYNAVMAGFKKECINIDDTETFNNANSGELALQHSFVNCTSNFAVDATDPIDTGDWFANGASNSTESSGLEGYIPGAGSRLIGNAIIPADDFFADVDFGGAVRDEASDWTSGWTVGL